MSLLQEALRYAGRGWPVFPCTKGKTGFKGSHSFLEASTAPTEVEALWRRYPRGLIGLATGRIVVFDADGAGGWCELERILGGPVPKTLMARTRRGIHVYFLCPEGVEIRNRAQDRESGEDGLDIRGAGGFVVLPPSVLKGHQYRWITDYPIIEMPTLLVAYALSSGTARKTSGAALLVTTPSYARGNPIAARLAARQDDPWSPAEEARLRAALKAIPLNSVGYDTFRNIGMALKLAMWVRPDGSDAGFELWTEFCRPYPDYDEEGLHRKWETFKRVSGNVTRISSIYFLALDTGWDGTVPFEAPAQVNGVPRGLPAQPQDNPAHLSEPIVFRDRDKAGKLKPTCTNARVALKGLGIDCRYDVFHDRMKLGGHTIAQWAGDLTDNAVHMLRVAMHQAFDLDPGTQVTYDAAVQECLLHQYDPVASYLKGVVWDHAPRLRTWLARYMGAAETQLNAAIGTLALAAAVRRVYRPGAKFDQIMVFESPEGRGKSSAIEILAGSENFSDQRILMLDDRGQQEAVQGVLLYEIADLAGMTKAEVESVKAFASRTVDRARPAYGRARMDRARRCIFFATTNNDTYLKSQTGNRRFWPVRVGRVDLDALVRDRDQLWAEAVTVEQAQPALILPEAFWRDMAVIQDERREHDPWDDALVTLEKHSASKTGPSTDFPGATEHRITSRDVLEIVLGLPFEKQTDAAAKRVAYALARLGWNGPKKLRVGDATARGYTKLTRSTG